MNFFKKLVELLKRLFSSEKSETDSSQSTPTIVGKPPTISTKPKPKPEKPSSNPYELVASGQDSHGNIIYDPKVSNPNGTVDGILWKPESDNDANAVVVVKCESVRKEDLKLEIVGKSGKALKIYIPMTGRANGNRVHFRPKRTAKQFIKSAPLQLKFFQVIDGKRVVVPVMGKPYFEVKQPTKRKEV